jgi:predicted CxxxxCH...CXXCH cytochrome family protein
LQPGTVPQIGTCISCHTIPPAGSAFPNISAAHKAHTTLAIACSVCHTGGGSGTVNHGKRLVVAFPTAYNAKTGPAALNPDGTCTNVSCHGGLNTKVWRGGRVNPLQDCLLCHEPGPAAGLPQNNSYYSGEHQFHLVTVGLICTDCHDMSAVSGTASHFSGLATPGFELSPASTMRAQLNFSSGVRSCSPGTLPAANSFSIGVCHPTKIW